MKAQFSLPVGFILVLLSSLVFHCSTVFSEVGETSKTSLDSNDSIKKSDAIGDQKMVDNQVSVSKDGVQSNGDKIKKNPSSSPELKDGRIKIKNVAGLGEDGKEGDKKTGKTGDVSTSNEVSKNIGKDSNVDSSASKRKDGSWVEDCDSSNECTDVENNLVACLRVPGNDSPHLSLLIQNKGKGSLTVKISAPDFVNLEKREIQLREKENKKVKISIGDGGDGNMINLTAGTGHCSLDFRHLISHNALNEPNDIPRQSRISFLFKAPVIAILAFAGILTMALALLCISIRRKRLVTGTSKYQRLDMELPVSIGGKSVEENNDGWDNGWDENWDDETPHTPSMPVTPSLSSKGLAPRRLNKEGWKD